MKTHITLFLLSVLKICFSQSIEEVDRATAEFEKSEVNIELFSLDSIRINSVFLDSSYTKRKILGFKISALDYQENTLIEIRSESNIIPAEFKKKVNGCLECQTVTVKHVTINWFNGTYTLKNSLKQVITK